MFGGFCRRKMLTDGSQSDEKTQVSSRTERSRLILYIFSPFSLFFSFKEVFRRYLLSGRASDAGEVSH